MKLYDTFTFLNELDMLELRMSILDKYVDYFVVTESPYTYSGKEKPMYFAENRDKFKKFEDKIIYHVCKDNGKEWTTWEREFAQRGSVLENLVKNLNEDDMILTSDVDEIPDLDKVDFDLVHDSNKVFLFGQILFYYYLNTVLIQHGQFIPWEGSRILNWKLLRRTSINELRGLDNSFLRWSSAEVEHISSGGWHWSFLNKGAEDIKYKVDSFSHQELNVPIVVDNIQYNLDNLKDPFFREGFEIKKVDITEGIFPKYLIDHLSEYDKFVYKGI